jgi:hypothetical protein
MVKALIPVLMVSSSILGCMFILKSPFSEIEKSVIENHNRKRSSLGNCSFWDSWFCWLIGNQVILAGDSLALGVIGILLSGCCSGIWLWRVWGSGDGGMSLTNISGIGFYWLSSTGADCFRLLENAGEGGCEGFASGRRGLTGQIRSFWKAEGV